MKEIKARIIDDKSKKITRWNKNYFFAATAFVIVLNLALFFFAGANWERIIGSDNPADSSHTSNWSAVFRFDNIIRGFLNCYSHSSTQHVALNMLCFLVYGLYLERKQGTLYFLLTVLVMSFITSFAVGANYLSVNYHGFSGVNYGFYAYVIIDYIFSFFKGKVSLFNIISGAVVIALIYLAACFSGGTSAVSFTWYPYDFMTNMGHYSSAFAGLILALIINISQLITIKQQLKTE